MLILKVKGHKMTQVRDVFKGWLDGYLHFKYGFTKNDIIVNEV